MEKTLSDETIRTLVELCPNTHDTRAISCLHYVLHVARLYDVSMQDPDGCTAILYMRSVINLMENLDTLSRPSKRWSKYQQQSVEA